MAAIEQRRTRRLGLKDENGVRTNGILNMKKTGLAKAKAIKADKQLKVTRNVLDNLTSQANRIKLGSAKPVRKCTRRALQEKNGINRKWKVTKKTEDVEPMDVDEPVVKEEEPPLATLLPTSSDPIVLPSGVSNIDEDDLEDPQAVAENVNDIYGYLMQLEDDQAIPEDFLRGSRVSQRMRGVLVNWLSQVHLQFKLLQETLYLTVEIVDRYLAVQGANMQYKQLQLVGVAAMLVASKYEEMYVPEVGDFVYITDNAYDVKAILAMELKILRALDFNLGKPLSINFLRRNSKAGMVEVKHHSLAKYILEECLPSYTLAAVKPSEKAAASLLVSLKLLASKNTKLSNLWDSNLEFYSGYSLQALLDTAGAMSAVLIDVSESKFQAAREKYDTASKGHASRLPACRPEVLEGFSDGSLT